jgi:hypothetical protein
MEEPNKPWLSPNFIPRCIHKALKDIDKEYKNDLDYRDVPDLIFEDQNTQPYLKRHPSMFQDNYGESHARLQDDQISSVGDLKFSLDTLSQHDSVTNLIWEQTKNDTTDEEEDISMLDYLNSSVDSQVSLWSDILSSSITRQYSEDSSISQISSDMEAPRSQGLSNNGEYCNDDMEIESVTNTIMDDSKDDQSETIPKTFLQLKGITVANYNMGCNFGVSATIGIMMRNNINILAIQEHTPWTRQLMESEINHIQRTCEKWEYFATVSKVQILIIAKQLATCIRNTTVHEEGRIIHTRMEVSSNLLISSLYMDIHTRLTTEDITYH